MGRLVPQTSAEEAFATLTKLAAFQTIMTKQLMDLVNSDEPDPKSLEHAFSGVERANEMQTTLIGYFMHHKVIGDIATLVHSKSSGASSIDFEVLEGLDLHEEGKEEEETEE